MSETNKWIPVSERLPETKGNVKALDADSLTPEKTLWFEGGVFSYIAHGVSLDYTACITHWQELPIQPLP